MDQTLQGFMEEALKEARLAAEEGEVPVGAVVVCDGVIVGRGHNQMEQKHDATCHGEILALQEASRSLGKWRLEDCHLYVTLEPCFMCLGAILNSRVKRLVVGAWDPSGSALDAMKSYDGGKNLVRLEIYEGILEEPCAQILKDFFQTKRSSKE